MKIWLNPRALIKRSIIMIIACIPALNEELTISHIVNLTLKYVDQVVVCDDGSADNTVVMARKAGADVISNPENLGKGASLKKLFNYALKLNPEIVVTLDADNQHDPNQIPSLIKPIVEKQADIVIGSRYIDNSENKAPLYRKFGLMVLNFLSSGNKIKVKDTQSGYRAFSKKSMEKMINIRSRGYGVESEEIYIANINRLQIVEIPINITYKGIYKASKMNPLSHAIQVIMEIIIYSIHERPMIFYGYPGIIFLLIGFLCTFLLLTEYLLFNLVTGIITIFSFFTGTYLFAKAFRVLTKNS